MVQIIGSVVLVLCASPIAARLSPEWWYRLAAILAGIQFVVSIFLLPETKFSRPQTSSVQSPELEAVHHAEVREAASKFPPRTWLSDMRLWVGRPEWNKGISLLQVK